MNSSKLHLHGLSTRCRGGHLARCLRLRSASSRRIAPLVRTRPTRRARASNMCRAACVGAAEPPRGGGAHAAPDFSRLSRLRAEFWRVESGGFGVTGEILGGCGGFSGLAEGFDLDRLFSFAVLSSWFFLLWLVAGCDCGCLVSSSYCSVQRLVHESPLLSESNQWIRPFRVRDFD